MIPARTITIAAALALTPLLTGSPAHAQFGTPYPGFVQLPAADFTWIWGENDEGDVRGAPDFKATGNEASFRCDLEGRFRPGRDMNQTAVRQLEQGLNNSMVFIQAAAETMNIMDRNLDLDWARLDCVKLGDEPLSEEEAQERVDKALEKAIRDRERRRARESR